MTLSLPQAWNLAHLGFGSESLTLGDPSLPSEYGLKNSEGLRGWRGALPRGTVEQEKGQTLVASSLAV